jgi:hypothetical protein
LGTRLTYYLAKKIVERFPPRKDDRHPDGYRHYVETHGGSLASLCANDPDGISEAVNDLEKELTLFWEVLRSEVYFQPFVRLCQATPFSQILWHDADPELRCGFEGTEDETHRAVRAWLFFVRCRQSLAGRMQYFAPLSRTPGCGAA